MAAAVSFVGTEFDIIAPKPIQSAVLETTDTIYKPLASLNSDDLEFLIPAGPETYVDLDIKFLVKDQLIKANGTVLDNTDFTDFLHTLFSQCSISLNGTQITHVTDLYNYRAYLKTVDLRVRRSLLASHERLLVFR